MIVQYLKSVWNKHDTRKSGKLEAREPLVLCECGCNHVFAASQMILVGNGNNGYDRLYVLHHNQIWGNHLGNLLE